MMTPSPRDRSGLTLIEVLVVMGILALLAALLLPAAQSAREAARRATCQDRLRQIGLALQSHATAQQALPSLYNGGFLPQPRTAIDEFHFHSWRTAILPQIEQSALFNQLNFNQPSTVAANQTAINVGIALFVCPSSSNPTGTVANIYESNDGKLPVATVGTAARNDYEAMGGIQVDPWRKFSPDLAIVRFGPWGEPTYKAGTGYSSGYRKAMLADITDGLGNTILVAERAGGPDEYRKGKPVLLQRDQEPGGGTHQPAWAISTHFVWLVSGLGQGVNDSNLTGIYAFHPGGANVGLADGSVHFLKETTSPAILKGLITRAGSEVVGLD